MLKNGRVSPGTIFTVTVSFQDQDGAYVDPATVLLKVRKPCGTETTYTYGVDVDVISRADVGMFVGDITPDEAGRWRFRWESTGTGTTTVIEDSFIVQASKFSPYDDECCWDYR